MKFGSLDQLIDFEKNIQWQKASEINIDSYTMPKEVKTKYDSLKGQKYVGINGGSIVTVVSDQFKIINVSEISNACDKAFGSEYREKSFRDGIARIYDTGIEDKIGKVTPLVIYPANLGSMAVRLGLHHEAYVCSNGMIMADNVVSQRIIHRMRDYEIDAKIRKISSSMGFVLSKISAASEIKLDSGLQLAMIVQGLEKTDSMIKKAFGKYAPQDNTLWSTIQTITYVATHETKNGYEYAKKAGEILLNPALAPCDVVDSANYVFSKASNGVLDFEHKKELFSLAAQALMQ
ncbi:Uncharacterised protein [Candidatus Tiddalikarchaeum anstoanum]|nr:Uncharacterised protein [Candidatus Tiddalikarchaeum anstoanum]